MEYRLGCHLGNKNVNLNTSGSTTEAIMDCYCARRRDLMHVCLNIAIYHDHWNGENLRVAVSECVLHQGCDTALSPVKCFSSIEPFQQERPPSIPCIFHGHFYPKVIAVQSCCGCSLRKIIQHFRADKGQQARGMMWLALHSWPQHWLLGNWDFKPKDSCRICFSV